MKISLKYHYVCTKVHCIDNTIINAKQHFQKNRDSSLAIHSSIDAITAFRLFEWCGMKFAAIAAALIASWARWLSAQFAVSRVVGSCVCWLHFRHQIANGSDTGFGVGAHSLLPESGMHAWCSHLKGQFANEVRPVSTVTVLHHHNVRIICGHIQKIVIEQERPPAGFSAACKRFNVFIKRVHASFSAIIISYHGRLSRISGRFIDWSWAMGRTEEDDASIPLRNVCHHCNALIMIENKPEKNTWVNETFQIISYVKLEWIKNKDVQVPVGLQHWLHVHVNIINWKYHKKDSRTLIRTCPCFLFPPSTLVFRVGFSSLFPKAWGFSGSIQRREQRK